MQCDLACYDHKKRRANVISFNSEDVSLFNKNKHYKGLEFGRPFQDADFFLIDPKVSTPKPIMFMQEDALDRTKQAFNEWRKNRTSQGLIPQCLWDMVPPLLDNYPKSMIRRALCLSSAKLTKVTSQQQVDFVEAVSIDEAKTSSSDILSYSSEFTEAVCDIELKRSCGAILKINSLPISIVTVLIPSFLGE